MLDLQHGDVPRSPSYGVYISQLIHFARVCSRVDDLINRNKVLTSKLLEQGYGYHKLPKAFYKLYYRHSELNAKYNICLKTLLQQDISEPVLYGDLVYKFIRIVGQPNLCAHVPRTVSYSICPNSDSLWLGYCITDNYIFVLKPLHLVHLAK